MQQIYDYLASKGINSFDDFGYDIHAYIRYGNTQQLKDNASWDMSLNVLRFGDGDIDFRPLASMDVVAHEFGHGITDFQINWTYSGDRAAFHEGMSDIWGAILEYRIKGTSTYWKIGEQVTLGYQTLRNIQNTNDPNAFNPIADTFGSTQYDNGGTYTRSGVLSHWFYIVANGESGVNDVGTSYNVAGIGLDKAEQIIFEAVFNNYLDNTTTYAEVRTAMINATIALFCNNSREVATVTDAWRAVGVGAAFSGTTPSISGNTLVCTSQSFSVQNQIAGTSRNWWSSYTSGMTVSPTTSASTTATRVNNYSGTANLNLTLTGTGGCSTTITQPVQVGPLSTSQFTVSGTAGVCPGNNYVYTANPQGGHNSSYTYQWTKPANWTVNYQSANTISLYVPMYNPDYGAVSARINNGCAFSSYSGLTVYPGFGCGSGFYFSVYPNPASSILTVEMVEEEKSASEENMTNLLNETNTRYSVELLTDYGRRVVAQNSEAGIVSINTERLSKGLYILKIITKNEIFTERILIE